MNKKLIISVLLLNLFLLISFFSNQTSAENQGGVVCGKILDKDSGLGVAEVLIVVEKDGEEIHNIWTDDEGGYKIVHLEQGDYTFNINPPPGYEPVDDKLVSIKKAESKEINFILIPHYDYTISGKVFQSDGKTPIQEAEIIAYNSTTNLPDGFADSNKDGSYTLDGLNPTTYILSCSSDKAAFPLEEDITLTKEKTSGVDFTAYDNFISGIVKDEKGNPIKDAKVSIQYIPTKDEIEDYNVLLMKITGQMPREVKTDKNGKYKMSSLTPGNYNIEVHSAKLKRKMKKDIIVSQDTKRANLDFTLGMTEKVSSIYGKVTKEDGITPVVDASVVIIDSNKQPASEVLKSNNEGTFRIDNLGKGTYYVGAQKKGMAMTTKKIEVKGGEIRHVKIIMTQPGSISGVVYCADKKTPAKNVKVHALKKDSGGMTITNEKGVYKIEDLRGGIYKVRAISLDKGEGVVGDIKVKANEETSSIIIYLTK